MEVWLSACLVKLRHTSISGTWVPRFIYLFIFLHILRLYANLWVMTDMILYYLFPSYPSCLYLNNNTVSAHCYLLGTVVDPNHVQEK